MGKYDDLLHLPHPVSRTHTPMPLADRAAQFSPFAALMGYEDVLREAARLTDEKIEPGDADTEALNARTALLLEHLTEHPEITVTYFVPDERKAGGQYVSVTGKIRKFRAAEQEIELENGPTIPLHQILSLESELF